MSDISEEMYENMKLDMCSYKCELKRNKVFLKRISK